MQNQTLEVCNVLLVDDDQEDYYLTRNMLNQAQGSRFCLEWVPDYPSALQRLSSRLFHAVLIDYDLGDRTGIDLIREVSANGYPAPLILYTGRGSYAIDMEALQAGASLYITKGEVNPLLLERLIRYAINNKRIEQELEFHLKERSHILESIQDGFFSVNRDWIVTYINHKAALNGGFTPQQVIGRNFWEVFPKTYGTLVEQKYRQAMQERMPVHFEMEGIYQKSCYNISVYPSADGISVFAQDISVRRQVEKALESLSRFPGENPNPVLRIDPQGSMLYSNPASQELLLHWATGDTGKVPESIRLTAQKALDDNTSQRLELICGEKNYEFFFTPIQQDGYVNIYAVDQTLRRTTEQALKAAHDQAIQEKNRLLAVMQALPAGIAITDRDGGMILSNTAYEQIWGTPIPETLSIHDYAAFHAWWADTGQPVQPEEWASAQAVMQGKVVRGQLLRIERFDGSQVYVLNSAAPISDMHGSVIGSAVVIQDITTLYTLQSELQAANLQLQTIMDAAPAYIWITHDCDASYMTGNQTTYDLLHMQYGVNVSKTAPEVQLPRAFRALKDGQDIPPQMLPVQRAAKGENVSQYEFELLFEDGELVHLFGNAAPLNRGHGDTEGAVGVFIDITRRKRMEEELRQLNEHLRISNNELEQFALIASHDMQEPLRKIITLTGFLINSRENLNERQQEYVQRLNSAANRMKRMIHDLLDLSRISTHGKGFIPVDLTHIAGDVLNDLELQLRGNRAIVDVEPLPTIRADPVQMHQLLQNLIGNAIKFHKPGHPPHVKVYSRRLCVEKVQIVVEDDGIGFSETDAERIFRPFERLNGRNEYEGTGIGLAICEKIVARHSGEISAHSTPGAGSAFMVTLPC